ncbi:STAS domain-containing protein [uncultured Winogradskyella sp.]|uniref:STAS domain-containing protein n=1 Tax=uncultured Winogradskyella sp. TaxID=395353 RepID=UPI00262A290F|nr:STAS domain-containing protein [uncultured Winogradskyella sp.]
MALTIKENNGEFLVEGAINASTVKHFQNHCEILLNALGDLTLNIENVTEIDKSGLRALKALYDIALNYNRSFYMVGLGCKEIYDEFRFTEAAA